MFVNGFDRWGLNLDPSQRSRYQSLYISCVWTALSLLPLLLVGDKHVREDWFNILLMYLETHTITFCFYNLSFFRPDIPG